MNNLNYTKTGIFDNASTFGISLLLSVIVITVATFVAGAITLLIKY